MTQKKGVEDRISDIVQHQIENRKKHSFNKILITFFALLCIATGAYFGVPVSSDNTAQTSPIGKITLPLPGSTTGNQVKVSGYTKNLLSGSDHVWLVVDKPDIGLCWPKKPQISPNCAFTTTVDEKGPKELYLLSLYAVNKSMNDAFNQWFDEARFGGLPMLPENRRLDAVKLWLE